jgi:hypothetical protein
MKSKSKLVKSDKISLSSRLLENNNNMHGLGKKSIVESEWQNI